MSLFLEDTSLSNCVREQRRKVINKHFPELNNTDNGFGLLLWPYLSLKPEKLYNRKVFQDTLNLLCNLIEHNPKVLTDILNVSSHNIDNGIRSLNEINRYPIHNTGLNQNPYLSSIDPTNMQATSESRKLLFLDQKLNPALLKLTEAGYANLILPFTIACLRKKNKSIGSMDAFNRVQVIQNTEYSYLTEPYSNTIRNAIAHDGVIFKFNEIHFKDRNNLIIHTYNEIISRFDNMVDISNGIALGIAVFLIKYRTELSDLNIDMLRSLSTAELISQVSEYGWNIVACLDSIALNEKTQLNIFIRNDLLSFNRVRLQAFRTAIFAEMLITGYDRYFLHLDSKHSRYRTGWAAFDGAILRNARMKYKKLSNPSVYQGALEENLIFFDPKIWIPAVVHRMIILFTSMKIHFPVYFSEQLNSIRKIRVLHRKNEVHRNQLYVVLNSSIVIEADNYNDLIIHIRENCRRLIKSVNTKSRKGIGLTKFTKYLPLGYCRLSIYSRDLRERDLGVSGLVEELICVIVFKRFGPTKILGIAGGIHNEINGCHIFWNSKSPDVKCIIEVVEV